MTYTRIIIKLAFLMGGMKEIVQVHVGGGGERNPGASNRGGQCEKNHTASFHLNLHPPPSV